MIFFFKIIFKKIKQEKNIVNIYFSSMDNIDGNAVMELVNNYSRKIKVKSGKNPVIGVKVKNDDCIKILKK